MKQLLFMVLLAIAQPLAAQNIKDLVFKTDLDKVNARIDSLNKAIGSGVVTPPVTVKQCPQGPEIRSVFDVASTGASVEFHGEGVDTLQYELWKGSSKIKTDLLAPKSSVVKITYPVQADGTYQLVIRGYSCKSKQDSSRPFEIKTSTGGPVTPPPVIIPGNSKTLGTTKIKVGSRTYTFQESPRLVLKFNQDGTFSDVTIGLQTASKIHKLDGKNVFYSIDYGIVKNSTTGEYVNLQNYYLPDGVYTIRQFVCDAGRIPNMNAFVKNYGGWGDNGVNDRNAELSEVTLSIVSDQKQGVGIVPRWLVASRALNFPANMPAIDWAPYNRTFSIGYINKGEAQVAYQRVGAQPYLLLGSAQPQKDVWHTVMVGSNNVPDDAGLYGLGRHFMERMGSDPRSVFTSELGENSQGRDHDIYGRVQLTYKGAFDVLKERNPGINPLQTGLFGDYGGDGFSGFFDSDMIYKSRQEYEKSLTPPTLYQGYGARSDGTFGFSGATHGYYTRAHIDVRNLNNKYYFFNREYNLPLEFAYLNEKVKLGTKTWQDVDRERKFSIFSMDKVESFVMNPQGQKINIEQARTGEIIHFAEGDILTKMNTQPPAPWGEMFTAGFWSMVLTGGMQIWDAPGSAFGSDTTKLHWWSDQPIAWRRKGEQSFGAYNAGQNGAPINSSEGITHSIFAAPIDAAAAGSEAAWYIRDRIQKLSYTSYSSNLGDFIVKPGSSGMHLNGFGPINWNQFTTKDIQEQKKGMAVIGEGPGGVVLIYYNGFLAPHEFEDVVIRYAGTDYSLGRVYGRQTTYRKL